MDYIINKNSWTLKLDAAWKPIAIIDIYKAFGMCYSGRAIKIKEYKTPLVITFPAVIVLKKYIRKRPFSLSCNRRNVFWRDQYICQYCENKFNFGDLTMDHVISKAQGGIKCWENIVTCCKWCNEKKGSKTLTEANMKLLNIPSRPKVRFRDYYRLKNIPIQWMQFVY